LNAEGSRQAAILNAEGFALALDRIFQTARTVDDNTMALQYLDTMKELAAGESTKWIIPMELTQFLQRFASPDDARTDVTRQRAQRPRPDAPP